MKASHRALFILSKKNKSNGIKNPTSQRHVYEQYLAFLTSLNNAVYEKVQKFKKQQKFNPFSCIPKHSIYKFQLAP